jgi:hypothetical protein
MVSTMQQGQQILISWGVLTIAQPKQWLGQNKRFAEGLEGLQRS